jgi:Pectate lyase superfamily protein
MLFLILAGLATMLATGAAGDGFRTRSGRGTHPLPAGYGPRGPVGPDDTAVCVPAPAATVAGAGARGAPYQAYPPDDSAAFRQAIAAATERGGGVVFIPPGVYRIDETVAVPAGITLHGAGRATHLYTTRTNGQGVFVVAGDDVRFTQFRMQGPTTVRMVQNLSRGIAIGDGHRGVRVDHIEISGFGHFAIGVVGSAEATITFVYDHHNTQNGYGYGVMVVEGGKAIVTDCEMEQNRHNIASNSHGTSYQCLYCYLHGDDETYQVGALDTHPGMDGRIEIAHNVIENVRTGLSLSDGTGRVHHNWVRNVARFVSISPGIHNGNYVAGAEVHDMVFEENHLENVAKPYDLRGGRNVVVDGKALVLPPGRGDASRVVAEPTAASIRAAITALEGRAGIVYLPPWVYEIDTPIHVPAGVTLVGDEGATRILATGEQPAFVVEGDEARLCRLVIARKDAAAGREGVGVQVVRGRRVRIDHCRLEGHPAGGILFESGGGIVTENTFRACGAAVVTGDAAVEMKDNTLAPGVRALSRKAR